MPPYCKLNGGSSSKNCSGAIKLGQEYITFDEKICNASNGEKSMYLFTLSSRYCYMEPQELYLSLLNEHIL